MSSGPQGLEQPSAQPQRYRARNHAILATIRILNERFGTTDPELSRLVLGDPAEP